MAGYKEGTYWVQGGLWGISGLAELVTFLLSGETVTQLTSGRPGCSKLAPKCSNTSSQESRASICVSLPSCEQRVFHNCYRKTGNL